MRLEETRPPEVGDKFATICGQKGVICAIIPDDQLPKRADGTVPDVFINPHSFLDRLTLGFFAESLLGKLTIETGRIIDGPPFSSGWSMKKVVETLEAAGVGTEETLYGTWGNKFEGIFVGPLFYEKLKHLAGPKCNVRGRDGPTDEITGQPTQCLAHGGGLRLGEMEMSALASHGACSFLEEFFYELSDGFIKPYCKNCHKEADQAGSYAYCRRCGKNAVLELRRGTRALQCLEDYLAICGYTIAATGLDEPNDVLGPLVNLSPKTDTETY